MGIVSRVHNPSHVLSTVAEGLVVRLYVIGLARAAGLRWLESGSRLGETWARHGSLHHLIGKIWTIGRKPARIRGKG